MTTQLDHQIMYDETTSTITLSGRIRLHGNDYDLLTTILHRLSRSQLETIVLDVRELEMINSSGINHLLQFGVKLRQNSPRTELIVRGCPAMRWQQHGSFQSLRSFNRNVQFEWTATDVS